jgi:hypothetical protein
MRYFQPAILAISLEKGRAADPMLAAQVRRLHISVMLTQNPNDLLLVEP